MTSLTKSEIATTTSLLPAPKLETLTKDETIELLSTFSSLNVYTTYIKNNDLEIDGKYLSKLTTSKLVKKSPELGKVGDAVERSLLAKEIRQLLTATGEEKILTLRRSSSFEAPSIFKPMPSGDMVTSNIKWENLVEAAVSNDGATGVIFINTSDGYGYVIKAPNNPEREIFATNLAMEFDILCAKQRILSKKESVAVKRSLSQYCEETRSKLMNNDLLTDEKGQIIKTDHVDDKIMAVFWYLYNLNKTDYVTIIELVNDAEFLCGMDTKTAKYHLDSNTEHGVKNLQQIGNLITFDAFVNNNDRIPVVHSNVGNGRNLMFGTVTQYDEDDKKNNKKTIIAIDQTISSFMTVENDQPNSISSKLYKNYMDRVRTWLLAILNYNAFESETSHADDDHNNKSLGKNGREITLYLKQNND